MNLRREINKIILKSKDKTNNKCIGRRLNPQLTIILLYQGTVPKDQLEPSEHKEVKTSN